MIRLKSLCTWEEGREEGREGRKEAGRESE